MAKICSIKGCKGKHIAKGFCGKHHARWKRHGHPLHFVDPEETRRRQSKAAFGRKLSEETKKRISQRQMGKGNSFFGKHHSEETKRRLSESNKNISEEIRRKH